MLRARATLLEAPLATTPGPHVASDDLLEPLVAGRLRAEQARPQQVDLKLTRIVAVYTESLEQKPNWLLNFSC